MMCAPTEHVHERMYAEAFVISAVDRKPMATSFYSKMITCCENSPFIMQPSALYQILSKN